MKFYAALVCSFFLLLAACTSAPIPRTHVPDASDKLRAQLNAPIVPNELTADNQSFEKVLHYIAENNHLNMVVNWQALGTCGVEITTPVSVNLHNVTLATALNIVLTQANATTPLDFANVDGILHLSTKIDLAANTSTKYIRKSYDIRDLITLHAPTGPTDPNRRMAYIVEMITGQISPTTWHVIQYPDAPRDIPPQSNMRCLGIVGTGTKPDDTPNPMANDMIINDAATGEGAIAAFNTSLIIAQTPEIQAEITDFLELLRQR